VPPPGLPTASGSRLQPARMKERDCFWCLWTVEHRFVWWTPLHTIHSRDLRALHGRDTIPPRPWSKGADLLAGREFRTCARSRLPHLEFLPDGPGDRTGTAAYESEARLPDKKLRHLGGWQADHFRSFSK